MRKSNRIRLESFEATGIYTKESKPSQVIGGAASLPTGGPKFEPPVYSAVDYFIHTNPD